MLIAETTIAVSAHCNIFHIEKNISRHVKWFQLSSVQVEIYHIQLQVQLWLLSTKLQDFIQQATQGVGKHCRLTCMSLGQWHVGMFQNA